MAIEDIKTFNVPNFPQWNFETGDTDEAITKQNAQNAALTALGNNINTQAEQIRTALAETVNYAETATDDAVNAAESAATNAANSATSAARSVTTAQQAASNAQAISETGLPAQEGNAGKSLTTDGTTTSWQEKTSPADVQAIISAAKVLKVDEITDSVEWAKTPGARLVIFQGVAPGAAGARSNSSSFNAGGGGGGQGFLHVFAADELPETLSIMIGSPGIGSNDSSSTTANPTAAGDLEVIGLFKALGGSSGAVYSINNNLSRFAPPAGSKHSILVADGNISSFGLQHLSLYDSGYGGSGHNISALASGGNSNIGGGGGAGINPSSTSGFSGGKSQKAGSGGDSKAPGGTGGDGKFPGGGGAAAINAKPGNGASGLIKIIQMG